MSKARLNAMREQVKFMLENPGLYACGDSQDLNMVIPILSQNGRLFSMRLDAELDPNRFYSTLLVEGPYPLRLRDTDQQN